MKRAKQDLAFANRDRVAIDLGQDLDLAADALGLDPGRADEHRAQRSVRDPCHRQVRLEGVHLAAKGVAPHHDVDGSERALIGPSGRLLYYRSNNAIVETEVTTRQIFSVGRRDSLFAGFYVPNPTHTNFDVHPAGDRFLMVRMGEGERRAVVVLNWAAELAAAQRE